MNINQNVSLKDHSTMRLGGQAAYLCEVTSRTDLTQAIDWANQNKLPTMMIGDGSNITWRDEGYNGLLIVNKISRFEVFDEDEVNTYVTIGAGENWDSVVERTTKLGLSGIEQLSLIPGTAGATPIQNVGAYGQELSAVFVSCEAYDNVDKRFISIPNPDCQFGYRTSRFKTTDKGRFYITGLTIHLTKTSPTPPYYSALQEYFDAHNITSVTPQVLRDSVIAIRQAKLPDFRKVANNGSYFTNPIVDAETLSFLEINYPSIQYWQTDSGKIKLSAAWLIEQAGYKNRKDEETGMATWPTQPLILVNEHAKSTADLLKFKQKIVDAVREKFSVTLEQEPELLPAS